MLNSFRISLFVCLGIWSLAYQSHGQVPCLENELCEQATVVHLFSSDGEFTCIQGCTNNTLGEPGMAFCGYEIYPTVWYQVETDSFAQFLNVQFRSHDMSTPVISVYESLTGCINLQEVDACNRGAGGDLDLLGVKVEPLRSYFIAVTAVDSDTGAFELCMNTISLNNICFVQRSIEVESRSTGGALTGPLFPGEIVRVCMNVDSFTAQFNGCQWFQGIVPAFGNGWDQSSFDSVGQPLNATINGIAMGISGNGLYGNAQNPATWDWFTDADFHWNRPFLKLGDFDGNQSVTLCNSLYDAYCISDQGLHAEGCCPACWDSIPGSILPGGWYAYGINGSCGKRGPPIRWDWGDGNSCGGNMGPWRFCFDLKVREEFGCDPDTTTDDLTVSFIPFADGDTGSWTGSESVCAFDQPERKRLPSLCAPVKRLEEELLEPICEGLNLHYLLEYPGVSHWTYFGTPEEVIQSMRIEYTNGEFVEDVFDIEVDTPVVINYTFIGHQEATDTLIYKNVTVRVIPQIKIKLPDYRYVCKNEDRPLIITPSITGGDSATMNFTWTPGSLQNDTLVILSPYEHGDVYELYVADSAGCQGFDLIEIRIRPCLGGVDPPIESNDPPRPQDPPLPGSHFSQPAAQWIDEGATPNDFKVHPIPAQDKLTVVLRRPLSGNELISISDLNGRQVMSWDAKGLVGKQATFDVSTLPEGLFVITLHASHGSVSRKLVMMKG